MKLFYRSSILIIVIILAISLSGCCCCCGFDGFLSKYKKPIDDISFPSKIIAGGKTFNLVETNVFKTPEECINKLISNARLEGIDTSGYEDMIRQGQQISGITEAKEFIYKSTDGSMIKGFVGKSGSPGQISGAYTTAKQLVSSIGEISGEGSPGLGEESNSYSAVLPNGKRAYATASRYSNLFIYAYSYDSFSAPVEAVKASIEAIEEAL
jgi:hypothetical protein